MVVGFALILPMRALVVAAAAAAVMVVVVATAAAVVDIAVSNFVDLMAKS